MCVRMFCKMAIQCNMFQRRLKSRNIKMAKVSCILHYKCIIIKRFHELSTFFPVLHILTILYDVICPNMMQFISWAIIKRLTESESNLAKRGIEAHFLARLQPYQPTSSNVQDIFIGK